VDLTVMHPELFSAFVDIAGDLGPTAGTKEQTVARLFGGSEAAWAQFDPSTVMNARPSYQGVSGWFQISSDAPTQHKGNQAAASDAVGLGGRDAGGNPGDQTAAAQTLCHLGAAKGMDCAVISAPGKHDWPFAKAAFTASLPWLAGKLGTPGVPRVGFPAAAAAAPISVAEPATGR
jgi:S-formylglutathione hydrolase FrmB